jgi:hypothetical protein
VDAPIQAIFAILRMRHARLGEAAAGVEWVGEDAMQYGDLVKRYSKET